jgi:hypothetical protein
VILLQSSLPCSENFFRYKKNYEKFVGTGGEQARSPGSISDANSVSDSSRSAAIKTIASPKILTKASPVNDLARRTGMSLKVDTSNARNALAKYAQNPGGIAKVTAEESKDESPTIEEDKINMIPIANFKSTKLSQIDRKQRQEEFEKMKSNPKPASPKVQDAIRLPNKTTHQQQPSALSTGGGDARSGAEQEIASPTTYLSGGRIESFFAADDKNSVQIEGEMIRKASETKLKKYWYCLLGKELYVYKNRQEDKHKGMHNLIGVFIKDEPEEHLDDQTVLYPFTLIFPPSKPRTYYL